MPTAAENLAAKIEALTTVPDGWANSIEKIQPKILARIRRLADSLETIDGAIAQTPSNLARIDAIMRDLRQYLTSGEYLQLAQSFNAEIIAQNARTVSYFSSIIGSTYQPTTFAAAAYTQRKAAAIESIISNSGLDELLLNDVRQSLIESVGANRRYSSALEALQNIVVGYSEREGVLLRRSRQLVSDSFATTDREFTNIVAEDLDLEFYRYVGGRIDTTRCFCDERNGKYFHKKELQAWGRLELIGKCSTKNGWAGRMPNTDESTIFVNAGGFNCQHSILPVSTFSVPPEVIVRNVENGNFKPTRTEREFFKL